MNKAIFLDRDGTINVDYGYVHEKHKLEFIPGVIEALKRLQGEYMLIIITNQSGIARGYFSEADYLEFQNYFCNILKEKGVIITDTFYCPHLGNQCDCRKPKIKMFEMAAEKYNIDFGKSFAIGDNERDLAICKLENVDGILFDEFGKSNSKEYKIFKDWNSIVKYIERI